MVDGKTEHWYFTLLKRMEHDKLQNVKLNPSLPKRTRLEDQFDWVLEMAMTHDKVFWLIDLDVLKREDRMEKAGSIWGSKALSFHN